MIEAGCRRRYQMNNPPAISPAMRAQTMIAPVKPKASSATWIMLMLGVASCPPTSTMRGMMASGGGAGGFGGCAAKVAKDTKVAKEGTKVTKATYLGLTPGPLMPA